MNTKENKERFTLVIGNKNYATWSLRVWLLMRTADIPFNEIQLLLDTKEFEQKIRDYSPTSRVPVLLDGEIAIWDSLAIAEHLVEIFPEKPFWPTNAGARGHARAITAEIHCSFRHLMRELPMNLRRPIGFVPLGNDASKELQRIFEILRGCRKEFGSSGRFLFGDFSIADAFYAPVATRFRTYGLDLDEIVEPYVAAIYDLPAFRAWEQAARQESWVVESDEL